MNQPEILTRLQPMIGRQFCYFGHRCTLVELLLSQSAVVLESRERDVPIQTNQYGQPSRRGREIWTIPVFSPAGDAFSDEIMALLQSPVRNRGCG